MRVSEGILKKDHEMIVKYLRQNEYFLNKNDFFNELNENELNQETLISHICFEKR
jgi:hypothetical protein